MSTQMEKVYVAVGNDVQEGMSTLEWTLKNWSCQPTSIVIIHVDTTSKNFVNTPFGKMPSSSVNEEKLEGCRWLEQQKIDKLLSKYLACCGKVRSDTLRIAKSEEPIHDVINGLIRRLRITKLVLGIAFMKSSKSRSSIGGTFYLHKIKPDYCELFIICGGQIVFLKGENEEGDVKDDQGVMISKMKEKGSLRGWFSKMFDDNLANYVPTDSTADPYGHMRPTESYARQQKHLNEIEKYLQLLSTFTLSVEDHEDEDGLLRVSSNELPMTNSIEASTSASRMAKIEEALRMTDVKREEAKSNIDRQKRAECIISLCNQRADELQSCIDKQIADQVDIQKDIDATREKTYMITSEVEENKSRLNLVLEEQSELAGKLGSVSTAKSLGEAELEKTVAIKAEVTSEINKLREQQDVLRQRIDFCRERRGATGMSKETNCGYRKFKEYEIRDATDNFSECMKLISESMFSTVYRGRLNNTTVAVKMQSLYDDHGLHAKMEILCNTRHPNIISTIGACFDPKCVVYEYMHNGSLQDFVSSHKNPRTLSWHTRIRITTQICSGLSFLHSAKPLPIIHNDLTPSNILLDRDLTAKITNFRLIPYYHESQLLFDVREFGYLMLLLLTGRSEAQVLDDVTDAIESGTTADILDKTMRDWPLDLANEFACVAIRCIANDNCNLVEGNVMKELKDLLQKATDIMMGRGEEILEIYVDEEKELSVPNTFLCPIFQDMMKDPHIAADGFSYELEAIDGWLKTGHTTSPMTNLILKHTDLTPNHTLRCLINAWHKR